MNSVIYCGMDVHKNSFTLCFVYGGGVLGGLVYSKPVQIGNSVSETVKICKQAAEQYKKDYGEDAKVVCGYEAGCLGFTLCRNLGKAGLRCVVLAPTTMLKDQKRVKTDKRDSRTIARCLATGTCSLVTPPSPHDESVRDFVRMRDDHKSIQKTIKQRILAFCLKRGLIYEKTNWTGAHLDWLRKLTFEEPTDRETLDDYLLTYDQFAARISAEDARIDELCEEKEYEESVKKLKCFVGIKNKLALSLLTEIGNFTRFDSAGRFASFLGLTASESSSGEKQRQGGITKSGNSHLRKQLIEAAQGICRGRPGYKSKALKERQADCDSETVAYADKGNVRMRKRYYHLIEKNKSRNTAVTAVARELACFVWGMMTDNTKTPEEQEAADRAEAQALGEALAAL